MVPQPPVSHASTRNEGIQMLLCYPRGGVSELLPHLSMRHLRSRLRTVPISHPATSPTLAAEHSSAESPWATRAMSGSWNEMSNVVAIGDGLSYGNSVTCLLRLFLRIPPMPRSPIELPETKSEYRESSVAGSGATPAIFSPTTCFRGVITVCPIRVVHSVSEGRR